VNDTSATVHLELSSGAPERNLRFTKAPHDCEVNIFSSFINLL
jgi:hypothetical protein